MLGPLIYWSTLIAAVSILWRLRHQNLTRFLMGINFKVFALTMFISIFILFTLQPRNDNYRKQNKKEVFLYKLS